MNEFGIASMHWEVKLHSSIVMRLVGFGQGKGIIGCMEIGILRAASEDCHFVHNGTHSITIRFRYS